MVEIFLINLLIITQKFKMITIDLSKQQALDTDPRATHQISFTRNLDLAAGDLILFIPEEAKKNQLQTFHEELQKLCKCVVQ